MIIKCNEKNFPRVEMFLFSLEFNLLPFVKFCIQTENNIYNYDYVYEFGKWRIITI